MLSGAPPLSDATRRLRKEFAAKDRLWASWGDYDRRQFERVCQSAGVGYPFGQTHLNVKSLFAATLGLRHEIEWLRPVNDWESRSKELTTVATMMLGTLPESYVVARRNPQL